MTFSRPPALPRWADVAGAIVTPTSGKLDIGYVPGERPPAQYENWNKNLVYKWIGYLDANLGGGQKAVPITGGEYSGLNVLTTGLTSTAPTWSFTSIMIDLPVGAQINQWHVVYSKFATATSNYKLIYYPLATMATPNPSPVIMSSSSDNTSGVKDVTLAVSSPIPIAAGSRWHIAMNAGDTGDVVRQLEVFWTFP